MPRLLEICVDTPEGLAAAIAGGAGRVELCSALALGGLTPSPGLIEAARTAPIPVLAMIRPRAGGFLWSRAEVAVMLADIAAIRQAGLAGVVLGALNPDGTLDTATLETLLSAARGLTTTLHRCFDLTPDPFAALEQAIALGFDRILTSGKAATAPQGLPLIAALHQRAVGRITILPGGGVTAENAGAFTALGLQELHASASVKRTSDAGLVALGFALPQMQDTSQDRVTALKAALERV